MKKRILITGLLVACLILPVITASCASEVRFNANLAEQFSLPIGQTVDIVSQNLSIKFDAVTSDSRCPTGAQCISAGEATCRMIISYQEEETEFIFTQSGSGISQAKFQNYTINFQLQPYPQVDQEIDDSDYVLVMTVAD
jgi:hypothetical protein